MDKNFVKISDINKQVKFQQGDAIFLGDDFKAVMIDAIEKIFCDVSPEYLMIAKKKIADIKLYEVADVIDRDGNIAEYCQDDNSISLDFRLFHYNKGEYFIRPEILSQVISCIVHEHLHVVNNNNNNFGHIENDHSRMIQQSYANYYYDKWSEGFVQSITNDCLLQNDSYSLNVAITNIVRAVFDDKFFKEMFISDNLTEIIKGYSFDSAFVERVNFALSMYQNLCLKIVELDSLSNLSEDDENLLAMYENIVSHMPSALLKDLCLNFIAPVVEDVCNDLPPEQHKKAVSDLIKRMYSAVPKDFRSTFIFAIREAFCNNDKDISKTKTNVDNFYNYLFSYVCPEYVNQDKSGSVYYNNFNSCSNYIYNSSLANDLKSFIIQNKKGAKFAHYINYLSDCIIRGDKVFISFDNQMPADVSPNLLSILESNLRKRGVKIAGFKKLSDKECDSFGIEKGNIGYSSTYKKMPEYSIDNTVLDILNFVINELVSSNELIDAGKNADIKRLNYNKDFKKYFVQLLYKYDFLKKGVKSPVFKPVDYSVIEKLFAQLIGKVVYSKSAMATYFEDELVESWQNRIASLRSKALLAKKGIKSSVSAIKKNSTALTSVSDSVDSDAPLSGIGVDLSE